jgi:hypothetical protein
MQKDFYFLSPVEVVKVTKENLADAAAWCGGEVLQTESRRKPGQMDSYVWVPTADGAKLSSAFPGMYITKRLVRTLKGELVATWAVFRNDYFKKNYFETPKAAVDATWEQENRAPKPRVEVKVETNVGEVMHDAVEKFKEGVEKLAKDAGIDIFTHQGKVMEHKPSPAKLGTDHGKGKKRKAQEKKPTVEQAALEAIVTSQEIAWNGREEVVVGSESYEGKLGPDGLMHVVPKSPWKALTEVAKKDHPVIFDGDEEHGHVIMGAGDGKHISRPEEVDSTDLVTPHVLPGLLDNIPNYEGSKGHDVVVSVPLAYKDMPEHNHDSVRDNIDRRNREANEG